MLRANPAALASATRPAFSTSYQTWQFGLQQHWAAGVLPLRPVTVAAEVAAVHAGSLPSFDAEGNRLGTFTPVELVVGFGVRRALGERLSIGGAAHALRLAGAGEEMSGLAFRIGVQLRLLGMDIGACLRNLGPNVQGTTGKYALPSELSLGVERGLWQRATVSVGGSVDRTREATYHGGTRWAAPGGLALLAGAAYHSERFDRTFSPRAGLELDLRAFSISYGYVPDGALGATHHLSLHFTPSDGGASDQVTRSSPARAAAPLTLAHLDPPEAEPQQLWTVWGGTYQTEAGAQAEVRVLRVQHVKHAEVVCTADGLFRVRIASSLDESRARSLAKRLRAACSEE